jgi:predicted nucleotidyltransferase
MIDIIPFGNISNIENQISWPPEYSVIMSVSGFEEVYQHATPIVVNHDPYLEIKVPTLPGLAVLALLLKLSRPMPVEMFEENRRGG